MMYRMFRFGVGWGRCRGLRRSLSRSPAQICCHDRGASYHRQLPPVLRITPPIGPVNSQPVGLAEHGALQVDRQEDRGTAWALYALGSPKAA
jgi:hypothetical protein